MVQAKPQKAVLQRQNIKSSISSTVTGTSKSQQVNSACSEQPYSVMAHPEQSVSLMPPVLCPSPGFLNVLKKGT